MDVAVKEPCTDEADLPMKFAVSTDEVEVPVNCVWIAVCTEADVGLPLPVQVAVSADEVGLLVKRITGPVCGDSRRSWFTGDEIALSQFSRFDSNGGSTPTPSFRDEKTEWERSKA